MVVDDCDNRSYIRQEAFEDFFAEALKRLCFDNEVLAWVTEALRESHADKKRFHDEAVEGLQAEYNRLRHRLDTMYVDKLDGKVSTAFFEAKSSEWRKEQDKIAETIRQHQTASQVYIDEGIKLLELAQNAYALFVRQPATEKRRLLNFLVSNSVWDGKTLEIKFKQPFDMIAESLVTVQGDEVEEMPETAISEKWLRELDSNQRPSD